MNRFQRAFKEQQRTLSGPAPAPTPGPFSKEAIAEKLRARGGLFGVDRTFAEPAITVAKSGMPGRFTIGIDPGYTTPAPTYGPPKFPDPVNRNRGGYLESETAQKCSMGAACAIHHPKKVEPWTPSIDEWDLLPDAPTFGGRK